MSSRAMLMMRLRFMNKCKKFNKIREKRSEKIVINRMTSVDKDAKKKKKWSECSFRKRKLIEKKEKMARSPKKKQRNLDSILVEVQ